MVIGDGMIATAFKDSGVDTRRHIIFASGVSNSLERDPKEFQKESDLLLSYSPTDLIFVYFSTVSIFDPSLSSTPYILHKLKIESLIEMNFSRYLIIRLPIVVGKSKNQHTLTNFLYHSLIFGRQFNLYKHATRYLIDLDDVVKLVIILMRKILVNRKLNLVLENKISVPALFEILSSITGIKGNYDIVDKGSNYEIDNNPVKEIIGKNYFEIDAEKYIINLLSKYYRQPEKIN